LEIINIDFEASGELLIICIRQILEKNLKQLLLVLLLLLFTAIKFPLGGSNPYMSTDKGTKNKYV